MFVLFNFARRTCTHRNAPLPFRSARVNLKPSPLGLFLSCVRCSGARVIRIQSRAAQRGYSLESGDEEITLCMVSLCARNHTIKSILSTEKAVISVNVFDLPCIFLSCFSLFNPFPFQLNRKTPWGQGWPISNSLVYVKKDLWVTKEHRILTESKISSAMCVYSDTNPAKHKVWDVLMLQIFFSKTAKKYDNDLKIVE